MRNNFKKTEFNINKNGHKKPFPSFDNMENGKYGNIITGKNVVYEAIKSGQDLEEIFICDGYQDNFDFVFETKKNIVKIIPKKEFDKVTFLISHNKEQKIYARLKEFKYYTVDDILESAAIKNEKPFIILLDEITDPMNFGSIIRSANIAGAHGIIIKDRNNCLLNNVVAGASSGALFYTKVAMVTNISKTIDELKQNGLWFACADMDGENMYKANLELPLGLVIGSEGFGVSRLVKEKCVFVVSIPMYGNIESLNASVSAGILMYEVVRRNKFKQ